MHDNQYSHSTIYTFKMPLQYIFFRIDLVSTYLIKTLFTLKYSSSALETLLSGAHMLQLPSNTSCLTTKIFCQLISYCSCSSSRTPAWVTIDASYLFIIIRYCWCSFVAVFRSMWQGLNRTIYCVTWNLHLLLQSNIAAYSMSEDLNTTTANYGWASAGISSMEFKCRVKFLGLEAKCQPNSIHGVNESKVTTKWSITNLSVTPVKLTSPSSQLWI